VAYKFVLHGLLDLLEIEGAQLSRAGGARQGKAGFMAVAPQGALISNIRRETPVRRNIVVVADDDAARRAETVEWLNACGIEARPQPDGPSGAALLNFIRELRPRLVLCRPGATGMAIFYPLRHMKEPPTIVVLNGSRSAKDEVHYHDRLIVTSIRTPVQMAALCRFIGAALQITARLDDPEDTDAGRLLVHPAVERFIDPDLRIARRSTPTR
jgi:DNA-binding response OmpR family regulator